MGSLSTTRSSDAWVTQRLAHRVIHRKAPSRLPVGWGVHDEQRRAFRLTPR
jgi:hypothetical protein